MHIIFGLIFHNYVSFFEKKIEVACLSFITLRYIIVIYCRVLKGDEFVLGYSIIDVIDKAIAIAYKRKELYAEISKQNNLPPSVKILSKVLADNVDKTFLYYEKLKKEVKDDESEKIDFAIYDKISFLISQFNLRVHITDATTPKEFLSFSLDFEKEILALFLDIQGRLVVTSYDTSSKSYIILSDMIKNKTKLIEDLDRYS